MGTEIPMKPFPRVVQRKQTSHVLYLQTQAINLIISHILQCSAKISLSTSRRVCVGLDPKSQSFLPFKSPAYADSWTDLRKAAQKFLCSGVPADSCQPRLSMHFNKWKTALILLMLKGQVSNYYCTRDQLVWRSKLTIIPAAFSPRFLSSTMHLR